MWTSKRAILRDLSRAQGGGGGARTPDGPVAASDACPLRPAERPPPLCLQEETEEEFFQHCVGDGRVGDKPDLGLIQQMLDMVRNLNVIDDEVECDDAAVISKLNPKSAEFVPTSVKPASQQMSPCKPTSKQQPPPPASGQDASPLNSVPSTQSAPLTKKHKKLKQRNIALESILLAMESRNLNEVARCNSESLKLLKPEDLIPDVIVDTKAKSEAVEKVNDWMSQMTSPIKTEFQPVRVVLDSTNMFKRKKKLDDKSCEHSSTRKEPNSKTSAVAAYVPSARASLFYQKYLEKSLLVDSLNDDIWTKAEKQMKHMDQKKRLEAELAAGAGAGADAELEVESEATAMVLMESSARTLTDSPCGISFAGARWRDVKLPFHRHALAPPCAVCAAWRRHRARARTPPPRT